MSSTSWCRFPRSAVDLAAKSFQSRSTISLIVLTLLTVLITANLLVKHATLRTKDGRIRFLVPIVTLPLVYSIISLFSIIFYSAAGYLEPISRIFEAMAIVSFFTFTKVAAESLSGGPVMKRGANIIVSVCVYQLAITLPILTIATEVLTAKVCLSTFAFRAGRVLINVCAVIVIAIAIVGIVILLRKSRPHLQGIRPVRKALVLKIMIVIVTLEYLIIEAAVQKTGIASRTEGTFFDWYRGLPAVVVGCETPLFAALMHWAFPASDHLAITEPATGSEDSTMLGQYSSELQK